MELKENTFDPLRISERLSKPISVPMPDFAGGRLAHRHTLHSALSSLAFLGISPHRIQLRSSGREALPAGTVIRQRPAGGEPVYPDTDIRLEIAGLGFMQSLPVGMWDSGGEGAIGTRELLEIFDDPLGKLRHWFREGAPLFRIAPSDLSACARWLVLFGIDAEQWPRRLWYKLAALVAALPQLSCDERGCAHVLETLLGLPVQRFSYRRAFRAIPAHMLSSLGASASSLGVDTVAGDQVEDVATLVLEIGPVSLQTYEQYTGEAEDAILLKRIFALLLPLTTSYELTWVVLDKTRSPRLGLADQNGRLGINSHLGAGGK